MKQAFRVALGFLILWASVLHAYSKMMTSSNTMMIMRLYKGQTIWLLADFNNGAVLAERHMKFE